jgi:hypothetical protein
MGQCLALLEEEEAVEKNAKQSVQPVQRESSTASEPGSAPELPPEVGQRQQLRQQQQALKRLALQQSLPLQQQQQQPHEEDDKVFLDLVGGDHPPSSLLQRAAQVRFTPNVLALHCRAAPPNGAHYAADPPPPPPPRSPLSYLHSSLTDA